MKCVICKNEIGVQQSGWKDGHNAEPVKKGRCCSECNVEVVVRERLALAHDITKHSMKVGEIAKEVLATNKALTEVIDILVENQPKLKEPINDFVNKRKEFHNKKGDK